MGGIRFILPHPRAYPDRFARIPFTVCSNLDLHTDNQPLSARQWFPCLDTLSDRSTYEFQLTVNADLMVISSGELIEQVLSEDQRKKTFFYSISIPTSAQSISLAVGPFEILADSQRSQLTHFCLPGRTKELSHSTSFLAKALNFYEEYLGFLFVGQSYKQVFVEEAYDTFVTGETTSIFR